ncbi:hypothetical protein CRYO30217_02393 [Parvicella tangerina]|uniref:TVP38/TMEM64 family membrane protein n=1 Tax=Parvicella tangerina TaxID=2829795 RepID=A0A916JNL0_9FLAO|nr:hypothetical protein CRYO30217_02393 [Parvicella tangerina]
MKKYKTALKYVWVSLLVTILIIYLLQPTAFSIEGFTSFFRDNETAILIGYVLLVLIRSIFFIPATVLLILGMALYPEAFWFLLMVNMIGILIGATVIYIAGKLFTEDDFFSAKHQAKLPVVKKKINEYGFWIVLLWSFFPLVPTDLVCYISGATHMKYFKFISAVFIGEVILVSTYLYTGKSLFEWLF